MCLLVFVNSGYKEHVGAPASVGMKVEALDYSEFTDERVREMELSLGRDEVSA